jgi:peroxiredoxin
MTRTLSMSIVPFLAIGCAAATVDVPYDEDGDGLMSGEESEYGTDPQKADSDGDGYDDGDEVASFTDPMDKGDHPYEGGWTINSCRNDIVPTGTDIGQISPDFELDDQFGETVRFHDFCGQTILLTFGAEWCGPCQAKASVLESLYQQYKDQGFLAIDVLIEDIDYKPATEETAERWADTYGLTVPVLIDPKLTAYANFVFASAIPSETLLKPGMEVLVRDTQDADTMIDAAL